MTEENTIIPCEMRDKMAKRRYRWKNPLDIQRRAGRKNFKLIHYLDLKGSNLVELSKVLGTSYITICHKVNGDTYFKPTEIAKIKEAYELTAEEVVDLFL